MLAAARVEQVAGDQDARFFQGIDNRGLRLRGDHGEVVEAFHWGHATSGSVVSALWFLLAPFGIVNAATFMLPAEGHRAFHLRAARALALAMLRLLGLGLTILLSVSVAVVLLDLWAWQKPGGPTTLVSSLALLASLAFPVGCFLLARNRHDVRPSIDTVADKAVDSSLFVRPEFLWRDPDAPVMRALHLAAGLLAVAVVAAAIAPQVEATRFTTYAAMVLIVLVGVVVAFVPDRPSGFDLEPDDWAGIAFYAAIFISSLPVLSILFILVGGPPSALSPGSKQLPGVDGVCLAVMMWCSLSWLILSAANSVLAPRGARKSARDDRFRPFARGMAATLVTGLAIFVAVGYCGALGAGAARLLEAQPSADETYTVVSPGMLSRAVYAWGAMAGLLALVGLVALIWVLVTARHRRGRQAAGLFRRGGVLLLPEPWVTRVAQAIGVARLKKWLVPVLLVSTGVGTVLTVSAAWEELCRIQGRSSSLPWWLDVLSYSSTEEGNDFEESVMKVGVAILGLIAIRLVFLGRAAARNTNTRRGLNVIWDIIAFWPRSSHPFVPPPYALGAMSRLTDRIQRHLSNSAGAVVLCGHSQGSLISFATLVRLVSSTSLSPGHLPRLGLLTFGSQLQVVFARAFPAYVNRAAIEDLHKKLGARWVNLYRDTDHVAGPVLSWRHDAGADGELVADRIGPGSCTAGVRVDGCTQFGHDWLLADPPLPDGELQEKPLLPLRKHGDYWLDPAWRDAVAVARGASEPISAGEEGVPRSDVDECVVGADAGEQPTTVGQARGVSANS